MSKSISETVDSFPGKKVLIIGDVMLDEYVFGEVERISPEAPVPVILQKDRKFVLGGAANTANNIAVLGAKAVLAGVIGKDAAAEKILGLLEASGIKNACISEQGRQTTTKTRIIAQNQQMLRIDSEQTLQLSGNSEKELLGNIFAEMESADIVVVSDYAKGVFSKDIAEKIMKKARMLKKMVCVDSKDFSLFKNATLIKPNRKELSQETGENCGSLEECKKAAQLLFRKTRPDALLATLGADGMLLVEKGKITHIKSRAVEVFDVSGAGDTVIATAALSLASGAGFLEAAEIANFAASVAIRKFGTAAVKSEELKEAIKNGLG